VLSIYVYYKIPEGSEPAVQPAARQIIDRVAELSGVRGSLLRRRDPPETWMEVYEGVADEASFDRALQSAVAASGFAEAAEGASRHTERFVPVDAGGFPAPRPRSA
jgi:hypothetical protein